MIDYARITVKAGDGGRGAGSFVHIKGKRRGKADGGDGGRGGDVYLVATLDLNTLETFRYSKDFMAQNGQNGGPNRRNGAQANELVLKVPVGTVVEVTNEFNESTFYGGQGSAKSRPLPGLDHKLRPGLSLAYDLTEHGQKVLIARGGEGGRGNSHLRDDFGHRPRSGEAGQEGEEHQLTLELKLIAEIGLIGLPNAGKSTLLAALTAAHPVIADYPFTTLEPNLGVMEAEAKAESDSAKARPLPGRHPKLRLSQTRLRPGLNQRVIIADIPGLIEGASAGKGLGDLFLRHIERTKVLVHLIDIATGDDPITAYKTVRQELKNYSKELLKKKEIVVLNKVDLLLAEAKAESDSAKAESDSAKARPLPGRHPKLRPSQTRLRPGLNQADGLDFFKKEFARMRKNVVAISAKDKIGLEELVRRISQLLGRR